MLTKRFQLDLSEQEHAEMERLLEQAGMKTKREFVSNALTLFRWAADEILQGRRIASLDAKGGSIKQLEMPALSTLTTLAMARARLSEQLSSPSKLEEITREPSRPMGEVLDEIMKQLTELKDESRSDILRAGAVTR